MDGPDRHTPDNILNFEWLAALPISGPNFFVFCRGVARLCAFGCSARLLLEASGKRALIVAEKGDLKAMRVLRRGKKVGSTSWNPP